MASGGGKRGSRLGGLLAALFLTACPGNPAGPVGPAPTKKPPNTVPTPSAKPSGDAPSPPPTTPSSLPTATPAGATPAPTATPTAAVTVAAPSFGLPAAQEALATRVGGKLLAIAQVGFAQNRGKLAIDGAGSVAAQKVGILSNNSSGLLANNGAGLISNNGGALISDIGGSLISNNGGALIANNGGGYRLLQLASDVSLVPLAGETLFADRRWPDGRRNLLFVENVQNTDDVFRKVAVRADATIAQETRFRTLAKWPGGQVQKAEYKISDFYADGSLRSIQAYGYEPDEAFKTLRIAMTPGASKVRDPGTGVAVTFDGFTVDLPQKTGSFKYLYENLKATEEGTLVDVAALPNGQVPLTYDDPLGFYDGDSTLKDAAGELIFTKKQRRAGAVVTRTYDLQDGLSAELVRGEGQTWAGKLLENGAEVAKLTHEARVDGSVLFRLVFPGAEARPIELGFGLTGLATPTPAPTATPAPTFVSTLAGAATQGAVDGTGAAARFYGVSDLARSAVNPKKFYVADTFNYRVRAVELGAAGATVTTVAGTGTQGTADGAGLSAGLSGPVGLVAAPRDGGGETVYFTDQGHHAVRAIDVDAAGAATVRTLAGGAKGFAEGPGATARFSQPAGLAWEAGKLYVADGGNSRIRVVDLADAAKGVTTLAGGEAGFQDGPAATALLKAPYDLALDAQRRLVFTDNGNKRVRRVDLAAAGQPVSTLAGTGVLLDSFKDGPAAQGGLNPPLAIALDAAGRVYVSYFDVRVVTPAGQLLTLAGGIRKGSEDGPADLAGFEEIYGLALTDDGRLLVAERNGLRLVAPPAGGSLIP